MIVKTGANYQAEGGYIEASKNADLVIVETENEKIQLPTGGSDYYAVYNAKISNRTQSSLVVAGFHVRGTVKYEGNDTAGIPAGVERSAGILKNATEKTYMRAIFTPAVNVNIQPQSVKYVVAADDYGYFEVSPDYKGEDIIVEVSD